MGRLLNNFFCFVPLLLLSHIVLESVTSTKLRAMQGKLAHPVSAFEFTNFNAEFQKDNSALLRFGANPAI